MSDIIKFEFDLPVEVALRFTEPRVFPCAVRRRRRPPHVLHHRRPRDVRHAADLGAHQRAAPGAGRVLLDLQAQERPPDGVRGLTRDKRADRAGRPAPRPPAPFKTKLPERAYYKPELSPAAEATLEEQLRASIDMVNRRKAGEQGDGTLAVMAPPRRGPRSQPRLRRRRKPRYR